MSCQCAEKYYVMPFLLNFQRNYIVEIQVSLLEKSWYSMTGGAGDVLHESASSVKLKNIHCEVQVILLQKSWYVMAGSDVLVLYSIKEQPTNNHTVLKFMPAYKRSYGM